MWIYEKKLEYPVKITKCNPALAKIIIAQYGGPDGELGAALRYLSQRFTMVTPQAKATLNDIGMSCAERCQTRKPALFPGFKAISTPSLFLHIAICAEAA